MSCQHEHAHHHNEPNSAQPIPTSPAQSLRQCIDFSRLTGLNLAVPNSEIEKVFKEDKFDVSFCLESDLDAQMIINIPFTGYVKLFSVILRTSNDENCPKTIKLYKNNQSLDFNTDTKPTYTVIQPQIGHDSTSDPSDETTFVEHYLPRNQFQSTTQLSILINDNYSDDEDEISKIYYLEIRGQFQSDFKKDPVITLYESAANPADHVKLFNKTENEMNI